jgi:hypothetical protein
MNLDALKSFDKATANGILAAATLASAPDPGVGERPLVLRRYEKEAAATLAEIRARLKIEAGSLSEETRTSVYKVLSDTLRQSILSEINPAEVLARIGKAGRLTPAAYNVVQPPEFQATFYGLGVTRNHVEGAVKHPDDLQHLMTEGMPPDWSDISLFMKRVMSRDSQKRHWLLVQTHRLGVDQKVGAAWQVYPQDVNIRAAQQPLDVLKAFAEVYGVPVVVGQTKALFIESELYPPGVTVNIDWTGAPQEHFLSTSSTTDASGRLRVGITYCIDVPKYRAALKAHGVKVAGPLTPMGHTVTKTTTTHKPV